ncbi:centromere protein X [Magallana gigas]|uniref:Centromere protein X n=1 Tax=Magallana gigas TaxID=29159 RepID=A0A8W8JDK9_MAGGI|nr:centromere protein X-like [Crassostrea gigas]|eukprot:XP_011417021.1 PREDICTED: centromere protein X-like [Crassostrea gigas]
MSGGTNFKEKTVQNILLQFFKDEKIKINAEALSLMTELLNIFVSEAVLRTIKEAKKDHQDQIPIDYFEKILPQLLLDF